MSSSSSTDSSLTRYTGRVKWFNNKTGYGFITVTDGPKDGTDVFVHHSAVRVSSEQYKYLVQGEYVDFSLSDTKTEQHEFQADDVCGVKGGKLMCETRNESRALRTQYASTKATSTDESTRQVRHRPRGQGPREEQQQETQTQQTEHFTPVKSKSAGRRRSSESGPGPNPRQSSGRGRGRPRAEPRA